MATDWAAVYDATFPDLVRFLYRKVWDADRARDLAQEVFVRSLEHDPVTPRAFLFSVAANLARDTARSDIRRRRHLELVKADPPPGPATPDERLEEAEQMEAVRAALDRLSERDREVLLLWDAGLNYDEIAARTGLARKAVGTTLTRARKRLVEAHDRKASNDAALG